MTLHALIRWIPVVAVAVHAATALAGLPDDFRAAYARAAGAAEQAHALKNEWIVRKDGAEWTTAQGLKAAQALAASGQFQSAIEMAQQVERMATAEVAQAKEQARAWPAAVIR